jgi:ATP/maltotriose-dependent transcriptional regulator MalT
MLAEALFQQGRLDEAIDVTHVAERASAPNDVYSHIAWRSVRAKALVRTGDAMSAKRIARDAVARGRESDFLDVTANALVDLGDVLVGLNETQAARASIDEAVSLFERKGNIVSARRSRLLASQLVDDAGRRVRRR